MHGDLFWFSSSLHFLTLFCIDDWLPDWLTAGRTESLERNTALRLVIPNQETELRTPNCCGEVLFSVRKRKMATLGGVYGRAAQSRHTFPQCSVQPLGLKLCVSRGTQAVRIRRTDLRFNGEWWLAFRLRDWEPVRTVFWVGGVGVWKLLWNLSIKCSNVIRFRLKCYFLKYKVISCCCNQDCENVTLWKLATMAIWNLNKSHKKGVFLAKQSLK